MTDPSTLVTAFVREFDIPHPDTGKLGGYFAPDAVYHNIPMQAVSGREAIERVLAGFTTRLESQGWEVLHQVANGDIVMNERIDRFRNGDKLIALKVMGVFEVHDGKITAWRDYFDAGQWQSQQ